MNTKKVCRKPFLLRWGQDLWVRLGRWSQASGWPLQACVLRVLMLPLLPLYIWRLKPGQGLLTFYRFLLGEGGFVVYRSERDPGTMIREESSDAWVFQQIFILGDYRPLIAHQQVRVIVDAGAYVGYSAIYFAEQYPHAFIYALEPEESNFQALQRNTRHYPNIKAIQAAVWNEDGLLDVKAEAGSQLASRVLEIAGYRTQKVPAISLKTLMDQYRLPMIDILKIDIEGAEASVFEAPACHAWLGRVRYMVIELHDHLYPGSDRRFFEAIQSYQVKMSSRGENLILEFPEAHKPTQAEPLRGIS